MTYRLHLNLTSREFEVEGPQDFVETYFDKLSSLINAGSESEQVRPAVTRSGDEAPSVTTFGELLLRVTSRRGVDQMLAAGWFVQSNSADRLFTTAEANTLLKEQSVKLGNPSQTAANLLAAKLIFRERAKYRVSRAGEDKLRALGVIA